MGGTGVVPGPVPGELQARREHRIPGEAPPHSGHGQESFRPVQRRAPLLLLVQGGGHGLRRRAEVHEGGLPGDDVEAEPVPVDHPQARLHLPLHGCGHPVVQGPVPAHIPDGTGGHVVGLLRGRPGLAGELPQRQPPLCQVLRRQHRVLRALAGFTSRFPGMHEQYVFDKIVKEGVPHRLGTKVQFLDTGHFGGFWQHGTDLGKIVTMHANCCVGLKNKVFDLKNMLEDWKTYRARVAAGNTDYFSWRVPGRCIH